jgi:hypothetical protein
MPSDAEIKKAEDERRFVWEDGDITFVTPDQAAAYTTDLPKEKEDAK